MPALLPVFVGAQLIIHIAALKLRKRSRSQIAFDGLLALLTVVALVSLAVAPFPVSTPQTLRLLSGIGLFRAALGAVHDDLTSTIALTMLAVATSSSAAAGLAAWFLPGAEAFSAPLLFVPLSAGAALAPRSAGLTRAMRAMHALAALAAIAFASPAQIPLLAIAAAAAAAAVNTPTASRPLPMVVSLLALGHLLLLLAPHAWTNSLFFLQSPAQIEEMRESWNRAWLLLRSFPFTGVGPGGFAMAVSALYPPSTAPLAAHAHNLLLQVAVDVGVPGLLVIAAIFVRILSQRSAAPAHWLNFAALCALAAVLIDGFSGATLWLASPLAPFAWLVAGGAAGLKS